MPGVLTVHDFEKIYLDNQNFKLLKPNMFLNILIKLNCYTSQLKYVFRLKENVSRVMGQNSLNQLGLKKLTNDLNFRLPRDRVVYLSNSGKFVCQPRQANNFYAVMAAKQFQTRSEEEIEQLLRDKIYYGSF